MDDVRGPAHTCAAEPPAEAAPAAEVVPHDRPRRVEQPRLRRPAVWSLALGAASLVPLSIGAFRAENDRMVNLTGSGSGLSLDLGVILFFVAGCFACVWLVRVQSMLERAYRLPVAATDVGLWMMWALPFLNWVLPCMRLSRWDKAIHGRRSWVVLAWAVSWVPMSTAQQWLPDGASTVPETAVSWWFVAIAVTTFALWAATVARLTRGAERLAHETGVEA